MQKQALALGYFCLAVFCIFTSSTVPAGDFRFSLLLAALLAALTGFGYLLGAHAMSLARAFNWLLLAQQPPAHRATPAEKQTSR